MISIIIPIYNVERYLRQCIESVIAQTFEDWEAILVNDGSKDGSLAICEEYAQGDSRIRVINKPNGGPSSARNRGLDEAQGEWITFMDSDDWLDVDAFQTYYEAAQRAGADIIKTGYRRIDVNGNKDKDKNENFAWQETTLTDKSDTLTMLQHTGYFAFVWNAMFRSSITNALRFDESMSWLEDQFFGYECLLRADKVTLLPRMVYNYRIHESGSLSGVTDPFVIGYAARRDMEYKQQLFGRKHDDEQTKCWNTYHQWQAKAIDSLYRNGYSYAQRKKFHEEFAPIDRRCVYAEEKKFFESPLPFCMADSIERLKRFVKR